MSDDIRKEKLPDAEQIVAMYDTYGPHAQYPVLEMRPERYCVTPPVGLTDTGEVRHRTVTEAAFEALRRQNEHRRADESLAESLIDEIAFASRRAERPGGFELMAQHACQRVYHSIREAERLRKPAP